MGKTIEYLQKVQKVGHMIGAETVKGAFKNPSRINSLNENLTQLLSQAIQFEPKTGPQPSGCDLEQPQLIRVDEQYGLPAICVTSNPPEIIHPAGGGEGKHYPCYNGSCDHHWRRKK
jgi:hypothetical protein